MAVRQPLDQYVLDAIASDAEQFDSIVAFLNDPDSQWRDRFERVVQRPEVLAALMRLVRSGLVDVHLFDPEANDFIEQGEGVWPAQPIGTMYFDLTGRGEVRYLNWDG